MDKELKNIMSGNPITPKEFIDSLLYDINMNKEAFISNLSKETIVDTSDWGYYDWLSCFISWMEWDEDEDN